MKNTIYLIAAIFVIIILGLVLFLVYPTLMDIKAESAQILFQRGQVATMELENKELTRFKEKYKEYQPNLQKVDALFVDAKDPIDFIRFLEKIASDANITTDVKLVSSEGGMVGKWPTSIFQISATGNFSHILQFSQMLEAGPYLARIQKVSIKKEAVLASGKETSGTGKIDADMTLQVITK